MILDSHSCIRRIIFTIFNGFGWIWLVGLLLFNQRGASKMRIFGTLVICSWSKPFLELSDFPENWYGKSLQHILDAKKVLAAASTAGAAVTAKIDFCCYGGVGGGCGGLTTAKTFFATRICCKDLPYQFSGKSDNSKYGLLLLQITSVPNILIFTTPL